MLNRRGPRMEPRGTLRQFWMLSAMCYYWLTQSSPCPSNRIQTSLALYHKVLPSFPICLVICCGGMQHWDVIIPKLKLFHCLKWMSFKTLTRAAMVLWRGRNPGTGKHQNNRLGPREKKALMILLQNGKVWYGHVVYAFREEIAQTCQGIELIVTFCSTDGHFVYFCPH